MCKPIIRKPQEEQPESLLRRIGLFWNCFWNVPMWTIISWVVIYALLVYKAPNTPIKTMLGIYGVYSVLDQRGPSGRYNVPYWLTETLRSLAFYRWAGEFFPVRLIRTQPVPPDRSYIFAYHPHGIISMGCGAALFTNGCGFPDLFPGIRRYAVTLNASFCAPFFREWLFGVGFRHATKSTLKRTLNSNSSIVLVPGGAAEALHTDGFQIKRRRGFLKLAIETNSQIVPCIGFGENQAFHVYHAKGNFKTIMLKMQKVLSFALPILKSPFCAKVPIHVVVGAPITLDSQKTMQENEAHYYDSLEKLYNAHKAKYGHEDIPLTYVD